MEQLVLRDTNNLAYPTDQCFINYLPSEWQDFFQKYNLELDTDWISETFKEEVVLDSTINWYQLESLIGMYFETGDLETLDFDGLYKGGYTLATLQLFSRYSKLDYIGTPRGLTQNIVNKFKSMTEKHGVRMRAIYMAMILGTERYLFSSQLILINGKYLLN